MPDATYIASAWYDIFEPPTADIVPPVIVLKVFAVTFVIHLYLDVIVPPFIVISPDLLYNVTIFASAVAEIKPPFTVIFAVVASFIIVWTLPEPTIFPLFTIIFPVFVILFVVFKFPLFVESFTCNVPLFVIVVEILIVFPFKSNINDFSAGIVTATVSVTFLSGFIVLSDVAFVNAELNVG